MNESSTATGGSVSSSTTASSSTAGGSTGGIPGGSTGSTSAGGSTSSSTSGTTSGGGDFYVFNPSGVDGPSCGAKQSPCLTITQAMANVVAQSAIGTTIHVGIDIPEQTPWPSPEVWPVQLGHGVTLLAQDNIYFAGYVSSPSAIFRIAPSGIAAADALTVILGPAVPGVGTSMHIGYGIDREVDGATVGVDVRDMTAQLSGVQVSASQTAVLVEGAAHLILGPDPVHIGFDLQTTVGLAIQGGSVTDICDGGTVLDVEGPWNEIVATSGTTVLSCPVTIGASPDAQGRCPVFANYTGLTVGQSDGDTPTVTLLGGATIRCHAQDGLALPSGSGVLLLGNDGGTVTGAITTVEQSGCAGVFVGAGTLLASNTSFVGNHYGVIQRGNGMAGIGTGALNPDGTTCLECTGNTVACNSNAVVGNCTEGNGRDLWANSGLILHAEGVALGQNGPASYVCGDGPPGVENPIDCTCTGSACMPLAADGSPPDDAQLVSSPSSINMVSLGSYSMTFVCQ
jgi:hypothetical protein